MHEDRRPCSGRRVGHLRSIGQLNIGAPSAAERPSTHLPGRGALAAGGLPLEMIAPLGGKRRARRGPRSDRARAGQRRQAEPQRALDLKEVESRAPPSATASSTCAPTASRCAWWPTFEQDNGHLQGELNASLAWDGLTPNSIAANRSCSKAAPSMSTRHALAARCATCSPSSRGRLRRPSCSSSSPRPARERWQGELEGDLDDERLDAVRGPGHAPVGRRFGAKTSIGAATRDRSANFPRPRAARTSRTSSRSGGVSSRSSSSCTPAPTSRLKDVPILIQGVSQANADRQAPSSISRPLEDKMPVSIAVPSSAELPPSSGRNVISIDANRSITDAAADRAAQEQERRSRKPWELLFVLGETSRSYARI